MFLILVLMLFEKSMVYQLFYSSSLIWVFLQTTVQEVTHLGTYKEIGRNLNLVLDYFYQLLFLSDFKGIFSHHHLIHHNAYRPNIYLLVILATFENLRTNVKRSATESGPQFVVLVH